MQRNKIKFRECCFRTFPEKGRKAVWEITHECNIDCPYCFQAEKRVQQHMNVLNTQDIIKIIKKFEALKIKDVVLTGGNIYYARHVLPKIIQELDAKKISYSISTSHLKMDFVKFLLEFSPRAINLSLDPYDGEIIENAYERGVSKIDEILKECLKKNIDVKLTAVITRKSLDHTEDFFQIIEKFLSKYPVLSSVYLTNPYEIGYQRINVRPKFTPIDNWMKKTRLPEYLYKKINFVNFHRFNEALQECPAGEKLIHIEPNGNIFPCHLFANLPREIYFRGNLLKDNVKDLEMSLKSFHKQIKEAIREYKDENKSCAKCKVESKCGGGCVAEIVSLGRMIEPELTCKHIKPKPSSPIESFELSTEKPLEFGSQKLDLTGEEEDKIISYIKQNIRKGHDLAHGYDHVELVVKYARHIAKREGANLRIVTAAAYFHDFEPRRKLLFETHTEISAKMAYLFFQKMDFNEHELTQIYHCIDTSTYGAQNLGHIPLTIEAKCVRDADWLDAIGARGIARVFAFGQAHGCTELGKVRWNIDKPPKKRMSRIGPDPSPIYHFFSKLLWVKEKMTTETGKKLAIERHKRLIEFLKSYQKEMNTNDN